MDQGNRYIPRLCWLVFGYPHSFQRRVVPAAPALPFGSVTCHSPAHFAPAWQLSYIPPFINSTYPAIQASAALPAALSPVPRWAIWLNTFWFSSLILSLSSASVGILVKQWLNEFQSGLSGDSRHIALLRQYRLNNLKRCHVGSIVNAIPVLLQGALARFLAGLLVLLWNLHPVVAAVSSLFVLIITVFIIGTTVAALLTAQCAYLSPQSLVVYTLWPYIPHLTSKVLSSVRGWLSGILREASALCGLLPTLTVQDVPASTSGGNRPPQRSWVARERDSVNVHSRAFEQDMILTAYEATLDSEIVDSAKARIVGWDTKDTFSWFGRLVKTDTFHYGTLRDHFEYDIGLRGAIFYGYILLCAATDTLTTTRFFTDSMLSQDDVRQRFLICIRGLAYYEPPRANDTPHSWKTQVVWALTTYAALIYVPQARRNSDDRSSSPLRASLAHPEWQRLDPFVHNLMAITMDIQLDALLEGYSDMFIGSMETYASIAFRTLRECGYSLDAPFKCLGRNLRAHALLLYAVALRSRQSCYRKELLDEGTQKALSNLTVALDCLSHSGLDGAREHTHVESDIIRPISYIVHAISRELDSFALLLPHELYVSLEAFFSVFKQSPLFEDRYWVQVPWQEGRWNPSDLYNTAQTLIPRLRNLAGAAGRTQDTLAVQTFSTRSEPQGHPGS
ncbi:hypothetical protein C8Q70DRAFT_650825 [Cubamyces menziesii]|nr:hypothetical protein C8Q70DRAFT_650825 [Cubamyces menziesii]